jgi:Cu-Zn family superoxide dismutase
MRCCKNKPDAVARIVGGEEAPQLSGCVWFYQGNGCVLVEAKLSGLPKASETGFFGFHIHQGRECSGIGFSGTEGHYNPTERMHPEHAGDLPSLLWCKGKTYLSVKTDRFSVDEIIGRTIVIHSDPDDFHSQPAGNAGKKIACGVIQKI